MIKYMGGTLSCDIVFGLFMFSWLVTRHIIFMFVIMSIYADIPRYSPLIWDPPNGYYITFNIYSGFLVLMSILQVRLTSLFVSFRILMNILATGASSGLVLHDFEGRVQSYNWTRG